MTALLELDAVSVRYGALMAARDVSFAIAPGQALGLVGESGSGKSSIAGAILDLLGPAAKVSGRIRFEGEDLGALGSASRRGLLGRRIGTVFQDPFTSLNPALTVGRQIAEPLEQHLGMSRKAAFARACDLLADMHITRPREVARAYPHQLSGGMRQRALIAAAMACEPKLLILDEPTTALDVTVEAQILSLLAELRRRSGVGVLFISHNLAVVRQVCDDLVVLYASQAVEQGPATEVLRRPAHPYTKGLLAALPKLAPAGRGARLSSIPGRMVDLANPPSGCFFAARCAFAEPACEAAPQTPRDVGDRVLRCWKAELLGDWPAPVPLPAPPPRPPWRGAPLLRLTEVRKIYGGGWSLLRRAVPGVPAVDAVSLSIAPGEVFGLVGESGSGKSTLGRLSLYLQKPSAGTVEFRGSDLDGRSERLLRPFRKAAQLVFQNADASLNPRLSIGEALARPLQLFEPGSKAQRAARVLDLLDMVRLPRGYAQRYPHQLSGGEKQRVAIARTLATRPDFIVCDEPVSALDVSVQAAIVNLLADLRDSAGLAYLFISHDLAMVAQLSDRIAVMYRGRICEIGEAAQVLAAPFHPYTEALLVAVPRVEGGLAPEPPPPRPETGLGCAYRARCTRHMGAVCDTVVPPLVTLASGHAIACHRQERAA